MLSARPLEELLDVVHGPVQINLRAHLRRKELSAEGGRGLVQELFRHASIRVQGRQR